MTAPLPLADLRVIDASTVLAGPSCARYLADFGADVIKVERPGSGDGTRAMFRRDPADDVTYFWKLLGRGKRAIVLDLKSDERSEEHTSELQSLMRISYAVFCLKKKTK